MKTRSCPMNQTISDDIVRYVEREIIPRYAAFDKAHREDHALTVIAASMKLIAQMPDLNADMAYVVAAFHDLGLANGREFHHRDSRLILEADAFIARRFSAEQIRLMGEAVEDHRASNGRRPRNAYGLIVAEADRQIDYETILRRTVQYGLANYPELDRGGHLQRTLSHLAEKYGPDGYLKVWLPGSDNAEKLRELHQRIADPQAIEADFNRIFNEEIRK